MSGRFLLKIRVAAGECARTDGSGLQNRRDWAEQMLCEVENGIRCPMSHSVHIVLLVGRISQELMRRFPCYGEYV